MVLYLWAPLGGDVLEGGGGHHGEADQEHVRLQIHNTWKQEAFFTTYTMKV